MTIPWRTSSLRNRYILVVAGVCMFLTGMYVFMWQPMDQRIETMQVEVASLDQQHTDLVRKIGSLQAIEDEIAVLRENLAARIQQFPENMELNNYRSEVVEIAKQKNVVVRLWKPEVTLSNPQHSEPTIQIAIRLEGTFGDSLQFLDELHQIPWLHSFSSLIMTRRDNTEDSSVLLTNIVIHGLTPVGIEHAQHLLKT